MSMGGGGGEQTTTQKADPWGGVQPYLMDLYSRASQQSQYTPSYYPGQTVAPMNELQAAGYGGMLGYAGYGSPYSYGGTPLYGYNAPELSGGAQPGQYGQYPNQQTLNSMLAGNSMFGGGDVFGTGSALSGARLQLQPSSFGYPTAGAAPSTADAGGAYGSGSTSSGMINPYNYGFNLPQLTSAATGAWYGGLSPEQTSAQQLGGALTPETYAAISNMMGGGSGISQPIYAPSVGVSPYAPQTNQNVFTPQIGFNPSTPTIAPTQYNLPTDTLNTMMSGQVDLSAYNPVADAATGRMTSAFTENVLPAIRDEGILTGAYGGSRQDLATIGATDTLQQNIGDMLASLYGGAYDTAMGQRATGAGLATQAGLEVGGATGAQNIEQAKLDLARQQLAGQLGTAQAGYSMEAQNLAAQLGMSNTDMQMKAQQLASQVGTENANLIMQAQSLAQSGRVADAGAMLDAAGLSRDLITQAGNLSVEQQGNLTDMLALGPMMGSFGMTPYSTMTDIGGQMQAQDQAQIDAAMRAYFYNQQAPWDMLSNYTGVLGGIPTGAGTTSTTSSTATDPMSAAMGTGMMTGGLYSMGMMNPTWAMALPALTYLMSQ